MDTSATLPNTCYYLNMGNLNQHHEKVTLPSTKMPNEVDINQEEKRELRSKIVQIKFTFLTFLLLHIVAKMTVTSAVPAMQDATENFNFMRNTQKNMPSPEVFVSHNELSTGLSSNIATKGRKIDIRNSNIIPIFFNFQGAESDFIPTILSKCYHLKTQLIFDYSNIEDSLTKSVPDIIYANSLSKVSKQLRILNKKGRLYTIIHNPILGTLFSNERYVIDSNKRIISEKLKNNTLIKSILHKNVDYQVTKTDYETAQTFLDDYVVYDVFQGYQNTLNGLFNEFNFSPSIPSTNVDIALRCVEQIIQKKVDNINRMYNEHIIDSSNSNDGGISVDKAVLEILQGYNEYDNMVYMKALQKGIEKLSKRVTAADETMPRARKNFKEALESCPFEICRMFLSTSGVGCESSRQSKTLLIDKDKYKDMVLKFEDKFMFPMTKNKFALVIYAGALALDVYASSERVKVSPEGGDQMMTEEKDNFCFVAFSGTCNNPEDWSQNFNIGSMEIEDSKCLVHEGFWQAATGSGNGYNQNFTSVIQTFIDQCDKDGKQLVFTGHSQGGAAASVAHIMYSKYNPLTISFGAPPFFSGKQKGDCGRIDKNHIWRFINSENKHSPFDEYIPLGKYSWFGNGISYDPVTQLAIFDNWFSFKDALGDQYGAAIVLPPGEADGELFSPPATSVAYFSPSAPSGGVTRKQIAGSSAHSKSIYLKKLEALSTSVSSTGTLDTKGFVYKTWCKHDLECQSSLCMEYTCQGGHDGDKCRKDDDCDSKRCDYSWNILDIFYGVGSCYAKVSNGKTCNVNSDCQSNHCSWFKCREK